jgi:tetratricopeptide (TPR) repeat protein
VRARALFGAALLATLQSDWQAGRRWSDECRRLSLVLGEPKLAVQSLLTMGRSALAAGDRLEAAGVFREAVATSTGIGDSRLVAMSRFNLGYLELAAGDYGAANTELAAAHASFVAAGDLYGVGRSLAALGSVALHQDRSAEAIGLLQESLRNSRALSDLDDMAWALELLGVALAELGDPSATLLLGAAEALRERLGGALEGVELALHERALGRLGATADSAWAAGRELTADEAVERALAIDLRPS